MGMILLAHLGPVQDFIASARRCRDLWAGSQLLSEASRTVAAAMVGESGQPIEEVLVFPGRLDPDPGRSVSVSNKLQLHVNVVDEAGIRKIAEAGKAALDDWITGLAADVFDSVQRKAEAASHLHRETADQHVRELFEFYWVAVPHDGGAGYGTARATAEDLLAARKNTREWDAALPQPYRIPKSSLDGVRESVIEESVYDDYSASRLRRVFGVRSAERLCGIGLLKRLARDLGEEEEEIPIFHSSSHIASAPTRAAIAGSQKARERWTELAGRLAATGVLLDARIRAPKGRTAWTQPVAGEEGLEVPFVLPRSSAAAASDPVGLDGHLLFPERLRLALEEAEVDTAEVDEILAMQRVVLADATINEPFPYYAMLLADGDRMGKAIDALSPIEGENAAAAHRQLSRALNDDFAAQCDGLVLDHGGSLLYAGGDDVLALLPAQRALPCARALRDLFRSAMEPVFADRGVDPPTLSVGLAFVHHMEPLDRVRAFARSAEKAAKREGRNRLAVLLKKRGGPERVVVGRWKDDDDSLDRRLLNWADLLFRGRVPTRLPSRLQEELGSLDAAVPGGTEVELDAVVERLVQLVALRRDYGGKEGAALREKIGALYRGALRDVEGPNLGERPAPLVAAERVIDEFRTAELIRDALKQALGWKEEREE